MSRQGVQRVLKTLALTSAVACAPVANAVIVSGRTPIARPADGYVGWINGSSCVAVGPFWFITAKHVGAAVGQGLLMRDVWYHVVETIPSANYDATLIRVAERVPGYHRLATNPSLGTAAVLGGYGVTAGADLPSPGGYDWTGPRQETWGRNMIDGEGQMLAVRFDAPTSNWAVPYESVFAVNDSGAGLFVYGTDGSLRLAGIAVSVLSWNSSPYGTAAFALNVDILRSWMQPIVDPATPISSGVVAPRAAFTVPGLPVWAGGALGVLTLASRRRRV